jgi:hypothetical protein
MLKVLIISMAKSSRDASPSTRDKGAGMSWNELVLRKREFNTPLRDRERYVGRSKEGKVPRLIQDCKRQSPLRGLPE